MIIFKPWFFNETFSLIVGLKGVDSQRPKCELDGLIFFTRYLVREFNDITVFLCRGVQNGSRPSFR